MTVGKWDAQAWHRQHSKEKAPRDKKPWIYVGIAAFIVGAAGVSATVVGEDEKIGICHQAGDEYVLLTVDEDSFEHGHHRQHESDYFVTDGACGAVETDAVADHDMAGNVTDDAGNATDAGDNATDAAGNATDGAGNATDAADNATEEPEPPIADVAVAQYAEQDDETVRLFIDVTSIGDATAGDVSLSSELPDVGREWALTGADAASCVLDGRQLSCWFGELDAGEGRSIELVAHIDQLPCGDGVVSTVHVAAEGDEEGRNNASSAGIVAEHC